MEQPRTAPYTIAEFMQWRRDNQIILTPKFQRGNVWKPKAKSYLIDSILRSMPIPPIFLRMTIDPLSQSVKREVVDGQQRLNSVFEFIDGGFPIAKEHHTKHGGSKYDSLPIDVKKSIMSYKLLVSELNDVTDKEVYDIFERINKYGEQLLPQELRNAKYFGKFKQSVYGIARDHLAFWTENRIFSNQQIAQMYDAELVSELLMTMAAGIRQTKAADIDKFYEEHEEEFAQESILTKQFRATIDTIGEIFEAGDLWESAFKRRPLFFSLFVAVYDAKYGLPKSTRAQFAINQKRAKVIRIGLLRMEQALLADPIPASHETFYKYARAATADPTKRRYRHEFIWKHALSPAVAVK